MKRRFVAFLLAFILIVYYSVEYAYAEERNNVNDKVFFLPLSLEIIEDEAFTETVMEKAVLPEGVIYIGTKAFHKAQFLKDIVIPRTTVFIGKLAIPQNRYLVIHTVEGSYAQQWAKEHHRQCVTDSSWMQFKGAGIHTRLINAIKHTHYHVTDYGNLHRLHARTVDEGNSMLPQERPELNPIDYKFP